MAPEEAARGIVLANPLHKTDSTVIINPGDLSRMDVHSAEGTSYPIIHYAITTDLVASLSRSDRSRRSLRVHGFGRSVS